MIDRIPPIPSNNPVIGSFNLPIPVNNTQNFQTAEIPVFKDTFTGIPTQGLANSYFTQANLQSESDGWLKAINAKAEVEKTVLMYNAAHPDQKVENFEQLLSKVNGFDYIKALQEKTGLSPEKLIQVSNTEKVDLILKASRVNEQIAFQFEIQDTQNKLMTAMLKSLEDDNKLSQSSASG
jgi:hypothetical protein